MFDKEFCLTLEDGLFLKNICDEENYLNEKIKYFSDYNNYSNKESLLCFFEEILHVIEYDIENAKFDFSQIEDCKGFLRNTNEMIRWYDIIHTMGSVFYNVFDYNGNRIKSVQYGQNGAINNSDMLMRAYTELSTCKNNPNQPPAYGATLIFATLFESELKTHVCYYYSKSYLLELIKLINNENIIVTEYEKNLIDFWKYQWDLLSIEPTIIFDAVTAKELIVETYIKYGIIQEDDKEIVKILKANATLNEFLRNQYFIKIADPRFLNMTKEIFNTDKLNLRNNLAHCNFERMNYYSLTTTALLYILVSMVTKEHYLK